MLLLRNHQHKKAVRCLLNFIILHIFFYFNEIEIQLRASDENTSQQFDGFSIFFYNLSWNALLFILL
jgi:hypothetical protein